MIGIDLGRYLSTLDSAETPCADPAGDLQQLRRALADRYQLPAPQAPVRAGYGAGAGVRRPGSVATPLVSCRDSGNGGWAALDRAVAAELAGQGIPTVGWDSLGYFWTARTPAQTGSDLERVLEYYLRTWNKEAALLIGYSFGADVLPFMVSRLSPDLHAQVQLVVLLSPSSNASFEFHLTDWLGASTTHRRHPAGGAGSVQQLDWVKRLCLYGDENKTSDCPQLANTGVIVLPRPGDHHFNNDYAAVAKRILEQAGP